MSVPRRPEGMKRGSLPEEWLVFGFLGIILLGALLLALPVSTRDGRGVGLFDSLQLKILSPRLIRVLFPILFEHTDKIEFVFLENKQKQYCGCK